MKFRVLGPLEVRADDGSVLSIPQPRQRAMLSVLLLHANEPLSADELMDVLWSENLPRAAGGTLRTYVWALRRAMAPASRLRTHAAGYLIEVKPGELDLATFDRLVGHGRRLLARGDAYMACEALRQALSLWHNRPLGEVPSSPLISGCVERLFAERQAAQELLINVELSLGRHRELVPELRALVSDYPAQEQYWGQLMLALYRSGRQAEALVAYTKARAVLKEEFGIEPNLELRRLQQRILATDPILHTAQDPPLVVGRGALPG